MRSRETREGWPLLTVGTEVNGDSKSTNEWGPFIGWLVGLVVPVQEIFPRRTLFQFLCPHRAASCAGSRAGPPISEYLQYVSDEESKIFYINDE